jgi:PKHD-type hydroxylase
MEKFLNFPLRTSHDPTMYYHEVDLFTTEEMEWILSNHDEVPYQEGSVSAVRTIENNTRKSFIKWLRYDKYPQFDWLYERLQQAILRGNERYWNFDLYSMPEHIQYTEYHEGGGHYDWHMDMGDSYLSMRKVSITMQLSHPDEYEGGDLQFMRSQYVETAPRQFGSVIVFPSYLLHRVTSVTKGTRKSLVLWSGGTPLR